MCGPMAIIGLVGTAISAAGTIYSANAQAAGLKSQAAWQERQAQVEQMKTSYAIQQKRRQTAATLGSQTLYYAGGGIDATAGGTPDVVASATIEASELDIQGRRISGEEEIGRLQFEAANARSQAGAIKTAGILGAVGTVIGGAGSVFSSGSSTSLLNSAFSVGTRGPLTTFTPVRRGR